VPHKETVMPLLEGVDPAARAIGAVNTIVFSGSAGQRQAAGYNTDWLGFMDDLRDRGLAVGGADCLVLGAGGSARAVTYGLSRAGAQVHVFARRLAQASKVASDLNSIGLSGQVKAYDWRRLIEATELPVAPDSAVLVVNTTPVGMAPDLDASPWPASLSFPANAFVYDLIYNPVQTRLMEQAAKAGCRVANGAGMLLGQGAAAFELWTGQRPDVTIMASALEKLHRQ
jgi:shikimate dehydrogenase